MAANFVENRSDMIECAHVHIQIIIIIPLWEHVLLKSRPFDFVYL